MKIGFEAKRAFTNTTGLGNYCRVLISSLATSYPQHEYYLFTPKQTALFDARAYPDMQVILPHSVTDKLFKSYWRSNSVKKDIATNGIDIYHGLSHEIPYNIHKLKTLKTVVTMHDLIVERYPEQFNPVDVKIYRAKYKYACRHADKIAAVSRQTKEDLIHFYHVPEHKIEVCYPGATQHFSRKVGEAEKREVKSLYNLPERFFLSVGSIIPRKNLLTVCKALQQLKNTINIPLVVIGSGGKYKAVIQSFVQDAGLNKQIIFLNDMPQVQHLERFTSGKDLPAIYQQALCLVYPSTFEGFGIPVLEALQSGLPVITSNASCLPETGGDAAFYVDPLSVTEMANAITILTNNEQLRKEMILRGYQHAQLFSQERCAAGMMQVYEVL